MKKKEKKTSTVKCNCRNKSVCLLDGNCQQNNVIYQCIASASLNPDKVYLETEEREFITIISRSETAVMLMKLLFLSAYGKSNINTMTCLL